MAEIRVEKKKRPVWPWILAILLVAAVIWIVADDNDYDTGEQVSTVQMDEEADTYENDATEGAAMAYVNFIEQNGDKVTVEHEYSHQALTRLSEALNSVAENNNISLEDKQKIEELRQKADRLMRNTDSEQHANILSDAFSSAAQIMENMQKQQFPDLQDEVNEVKNAANEVKPNVLVTNQKSAVKNFFQKSADAVEAMAENQNV